MPVTILAVHNDIAFLFALALKLENSQIGLIPAHSVKNAERLVTELGLEPDLLIINCKIRGVCAFATESLKRWPAVKVVAIVSENQRCLDCRRAVVATIRESPSPTIAQCVDIVSTLTHLWHAAIQ
jgi:hypothetical protein